MYLPICQLIHQLVIFNHAKSVEQCYVIFYRRNTTALMRNYKIISHLTLLILTTPGQDHEPS